MDPRARHQDPVWARLGPPRVPPVVNSNMLGPDRVHDAKKNNYNLVLF